MVVAVWRGFLLLDSDFELIQAEPDPVAVAQFLGGAAAYGFAGLVEKSAIGTEITQLPFAVAIYQLTVLFRQMALGIGNDPFVALAPAYGKLTATDLASLRGDIVGTADHDKL